MENLTLAQAINAKLCHDLAGSIGVVANCTSMIETENSKNSAIFEQSMKLLSDESAKLVRKLVFYRNTYGLLEKETKISLIHLSKILQDYFENTKIQLQVDHSQGLISLDASIAKAISSFCSILADCANYKDDISINCTEHPETKKIDICVQAQRAMIDMETIGILVGQQKSINVRNCREHYVYTLCQQANYKVIVNKRSDTMEFKFIQE